MNTKLKKGKPQIMTPKEYATLRGISLQAVTKAIRNKNEMPGVVKVDKISRVYLLKVVVENIS